MTRIALILAVLPTLASGQSTKTIDCYCTDKGGSRIELGESVCLQVGGRMFTAQCQMSLNVPMWRETQEGCLSSSVDLPFSPFGADALKQPVQTFAIHPEV